MDQTRKQCEVVFDNVMVGRDRLIGMIDGAADPPEGAEYCHRSPMR